MGRIHEDLTPTGLRQAAESAARAEDATALRDNINAGLKRIDELEPNKKEADKYKLEFLNDTNKALPADGQLRVTVRDANNPEGSTVISETHNTGFDVFAAFRGPRVEMTDLQGKQVRPENPHDVYGVGGLGSGL
jgi:hypothetical protein